MNTEYKKFKFIFYPLAYSSLHCTSIASATNSLWSSFFPQSASDSFSHSQSLFFSEDENANVPPEITGRATLTRPTYSAQFKRRGEPVGEKEIALAAAQPQVHAFQEYAGQSAERLFYNSVPDRRNDKAARSEQN